MPVTGPGSLQTGRGSPLPAHLSCTFQTCETCPTDQKHWAPQVTLILCSAPTSAHRYNSERLAIAGSGRITFFHDTWPALNHECCFKALAVGRLAASFAIVAFIICTASEPSQPAAQRPIQCSLHAMLILQTSVRGYFGLAAHI